MSHRPTAEQPGAGRTDGRQQRTETDPPIDRRPGTGTRDELAPGVLMRAMGVGEADHEVPERGGVAWAPSPARARFAAAVAIAGTALLAGILAPGAGSGRNSAKSGSNEPAAANTVGLVKAQGDAHVKSRKFGSNVVLGAAAAAAVSMGALAGDAVQWRVEDGGNGHWYQPTIHSFENFAAAQSYSQAQGGHLVTLTTAAENSFAAKLSLGDYLLGGFQDTTASDYNEPSGGWRWVTGEPWNFTAWNSQSNEPNDGDGGSSEQYLLWWRVGVPDADRWNDGFNDQTGSAWNCRAIIEWSADCNSDGIVDYGQILAGQLADANTNGIPDICECATHPELGACRCAGDIVADGAVNGADLGTLLAYWGPRTSGSFSIASDINGDARIDGSDLGVLLANWGTCTPAGPTVPGWATLIEAFPDPAVVTDPALRMAIAATGLAWRVRDMGTGIEMLLVPPGTFQMGCSQGSDTLGCHSWELPVHQVTLTSAFYLGRYEVTQAQWSVKMGSNPSYFKFDSDSASRPVEQVSWSTVQSYLAATSLRLPTEAEWEYACRAGTSTPYYNGSTDESTLGTLAWYSQNSGSQTHPVGGRAPNALGLYDMIGNVWEWASDWWGGYPDGSQVNPSGPSNGSTRVRRSSSWRDVEPNVRSSTRPNGGPDQGYDIGFRVARNP